MGDLQNDILSAIQKAKYKSQYDKIPFSVLCDYLPEYMLNDEKLMGDLENVFYEWFLYSDEKPDKFIFNGLKELKKNDD